MGQSFTEKILLPKGSTIVEGSFQVQVGTYWIDGNGEISQKLTAQQLLNQYGVIITASNRDEELVGSLGLLEYSDIEVVIDQKPTGGCAFKLQIPA
jgi:hypothetical protein